LRRNGGNQRKVAEISGHFLPVNLACNQGLPTTTIENPNLHFLPVIDDVFWSGMNYFVSLKISPP